MSTIMERTPVVQRARTPKRYSSELEKKLMIENLRLAVKIYGKDRLRKGFKERKQQNAQIS